MDCKRRRDSCTGDFSDYDKPRKVFKRHEVESEDEVIKYSTDEQNLYNQNGYDNEEREEDGEDCPVEISKMSCGNKRIVSQSPKKQKKKHGKENGTNSLNDAIKDVEPTKRKNSLLDTCDKSKRMRSNFSEVTAERSSINLEDQHHPGLLTEIDNTSSTNQFPHHFSHRLIAIMFQSELSILCLLRKSMHKEKYCSVTVKFKNSQNGYFDDIALRYSETSFHIKIEYVDKFYIDNDINYDILFSRVKGNFSVNNYLNNFVKKIICDSRSLTDQPEYFIIYTNSGLDLTIDKKLNHGRARKFYPLQLNRINLESISGFNDFLLTNDNNSDSNANECEFYQFTKNETREELLKRLDFSPTVKKEIEKSEFSEEMLKEAFLDRLVLAVNQPCREKLVSIIKNEILENNVINKDYTRLKEKVLKKLSSPDRKSVV